MNKREKRGGPGGGVWEGEAKAPIIENNQLFFPFRFSIHLDIDQLN